MFNLPAKPSVFVHTSLNAWTEILSCNRIFILARDFYFPYATTAECPKWSRCQTSVTCKSKQSAWDDIKSQTQRKTTKSGVSAYYYYYHFASAAVAVDSSRMTALSSASWSKFSPPSYCVNGHVSTMWLMVCHWPWSQEGDWVRPHLCKLAQHGPWPVQKRFIRDHVWQGRSKPGCQIVGSVTIAWLTTEADD